VITTQDLFSAAEEIRGQLVTVGLGRAVDTDDLAALQRAQAALEALIDRVADALVCGRYAPHPGDPCARVQRDDATRGDP